MKLMEYIRKFTLYVLLPLLLGSIVFYIYIYFDSLVNYLLFDLFMVNIVLLLIILIILFLFWLLGAFILIALIAVKKIIFGDE